MEYRPCTKFSEGRLDFQEKLKGTKDQPSERRPDPMKNGHCIADCFADDERKLKGSLKANHEICKEPVQDVATKQSAISDTTLVTCRSKIKGITSGPVGISKGNFKGWNSIHNPAVCFGEIPPDQESEPKSDGEDFDEIYTSEADMEVGKTGFQSWSPINQSGIFYGAVSIDLDERDYDERDYGERFCPELLMNDDWIEYWFLAKEFLGLMRQAARYLL